MYNISVSTYSITHWNQIVNTLFDLFLDLPQPRSNLLIRHPILPALLDDCSFEFAERAGVRLRERRGFRRVDIFLFHRSPPLPFPLPFPLPGLSPFQGDIWGGGRFFVRVMP